jgi:predicted nuclease of predicted toxin-antitoxin system
VSSRFKLDENLSHDVETELRSAGYDVRTALDQGLGGEHDAGLLAACRAEDRILITFDLDFANVRTYPPREQPGVWVLRPMTQSIDDTLAAVRTAIELLREEGPENKLWVVQPGRVRVRA